MAEKYWFKTQGKGIVWYPASWQGLVIILVYFATLLYAFIQIDSHSHSVSDTLINFFPRFFILSALLTCITYLKGEQQKKKS